MPFGESWGPLTSKASTEEYKPAVTNETAKRVILSTAPTVVGTAASHLAHGNPVVGKVASEGMEYLCRKHPQAVTETAGVAGAIGVMAASNVAVIALAGLVGPLLPIGMAVAGVALFVREAKKP